MNHEIKGTLAKLLATENLVVEHKKVETASFDVENRVLTLPIWETSNDVYNMLVGHEVGHALFTPNEDPKKIGVPMAFINVTEDARIEKLMKRKYPGLTKDFYKGYETLNDIDFFDINTRDIEELTFIDRINLHYKIGSYAMIPFSDAERPLRDAVGVAETFQEAIDAAKDIFKHMKAEFDKKKEEEKEQETSFSIPVSGGNGATPPDFAEGEDLSEGKGQQEEKEEKEEATPQEPELDPNQPWDKKESEVDAFGGDSALGELPDFGREGGETWEEHSEVTTQQSFDSKTQEMAKTDGHESIYTNVPSVKTDKVVVKSDYIWDKCESVWREDTEIHNGTKSFDWIDREYHEFLQGSKKDVAYLVKEFECKKAATSHARSAESRTGTLDTTKLHKYKYSDDIFRKITAVPNGKNHGLVFLLDWSGSMSNEIFPTIKQLINLCQFCNKVNIPFDVYAFVCEHDGYYGYRDRDQQEKIAKQELGDLWIDSRFRLYNFLTSEVNNKEFTRHARNLFRVGKYFERYHSYSYDSYRVPQPPHFLGLGGTPLNEGLATMADFLPKWKQAHGVEKCHLVVLSDGEAQQIGYVHQKTEYIERDYEYHCGYNTVLRDKKTGRYYTDIKNGGYGMTSALIKVIRDRYTWCNVIGFRLCSPREFSSYLNRQGIWEQDEYKKQWKKDKLAIVKTSAYSELYVIAPPKTEETSMEVKENPNKRDLRNAFKKSLKGKGSNRRLLSTFAGQIA